MRRDIADGKRGLALLRSTRAVKARCLAVKVGEAARAEAVVLTSW